MIASARGLVSGDAARRILRVAEDVDRALRPGRGVTLVALEIHLDDPAGRVDAVFRIPRASFPLEQASPVGPAWVRFLETSTDAGGAVARIPFVELEYDLRDDAIPLPWIGPAIEPRAAEGVAAVLASHGALPPSDWVSLRAAHAVLERLGVSAARWHARLETAFVALPEDGLINHLTWGGARPGGPPGGDAIRFIASVPRPAASGYLQRLGWRGDAESLFRWIRRWFTFAPRIDLDVDLDLDGASAKTAAYLSFPAPRLRDSALVELLDRLVDDGVITSAAREALRGWVDEVEGRTDRILTMKVVLDAGRVRAKAYLEGSVA